MRTSTLFAGTILVMAAVNIGAQASPRSSTSTISEALDSWITNTEQHVVPLIDAMPANGFEFAPPRAFGEFAAVRTFAEQAKHLAADNYWMAALISSRQPSREMSAETGPDSIRTKAQIMSYVAGSFAALHAAVATIDAANVAAPMKSPSAWQRTRLSFAIDAVAHSFDHYGQLVEYLRMNGIVPPASRPAALPHPPVTPRAALRPGGTLGAATKVIGQPNDQRQQEAAASHHRRWFRNWSAISVKREIHREQRRRRGAAHAAHMRMPNRSKTGPTARGVRSRSYGPCQAPARARKNCS